MDHFSITANGLDLEFSLAASVTGPDSLIVGQYAAPPTLGTANGVPATIDLRFIFPGACSACGIIFIGTTPLDPNAGFGSSYQIGFSPFYELTAPDQNDVTFTLIPGTYSSDDIIHEFYDVIPATITVTAENTAITPEPSTLSLTALAALVSLCFARRRSADLT